MRLKRLALLTRMFAHGAVAALRVYVRRALGRARVKSWTLPQELVRDVQAAVFRVMCQAEPSLVRTLAPIRVAPDVAKQVTWTTAELGGVPAECAVPNGSGEERTIFYLHGGGYNLGSTATHRDLLSRLALAADARVWSIDYRLAPEHPFPAAIEDAESARRELRAQGLDPAATVIAGDSAGGGLTCALLQRLQAASEPFPAGAVLICPAVNPSDWGASMDSNAAYDYLDRRICDGWLDAYRGSASRRDPLISPQLADPTGWPPTLVHGGGREVLIDQIDAFVEHLRKAGVPVDVERLDDEIHVWHLFAQILPAGRDSIARIGAWVRARTARTHHAAVAR